MLSSPISFQQGLDYLVTEVHIEILSTAPMRLTRALAGFLYHLLLYLEKSAGGISQDEGKDEIDL